MKCENCQSEQFILTERATVYHDLEFDDESEEYYLSNHEVGVGDENWIRISCVGCSATIPTSVMNDYVLG